MKYLVYVFALNCLSMLAGDSCNVEVVDEDDEDIHIVLTIDDLAPGIWSSIAEADLIVWGKPILNLEKTSDNRSSWWLKELELDIHSTIIGESLSFLKVVPNNPNNYIQLGGNPDRPRFFFLNKDEGTWVHDTSLLIKEDIEPSFFDWIKLYRQVLLFPEGNEKESKLVDLYLSMAEIEKLTPDGLDGLWRVYWHRMDLHKWFDQSINDRSADMNPLMMTQRKRLAKILLPEGDIYWQFWRFVWPIEKESMKKALSIALEDVYFPALAMQIQAHFGDCYTRALMEERDALEKKFYETKNENLWDRIEILEEDFTRHMLILLKGRR